MALPCTYTRACFEKLSLGEWFSAKEQSCAAHQKASQLGRSGILPSESQIQVHIQDQGFFVFQEPCQMSSDEM